MNKENTIKIIITDDYSNNPRLDKYFDQGYHLLMAFPIYNEQGALWGIQYYLKKMPEEEETFL